MNTFLALVGGTILTGTGERLEGGNVLIDGGKIVHVGYEMPFADARVIDVKGKVVTPGLIDAHTHLGITEEGIGWEGMDSNESSDPITPHLRAIDAINPADLAFRDALEGGITTVIASPGSANVLGGTSLAIKTFGTVVDRMVVRNPVGMKAALGENPKRVHGTNKKAPFTRMGSAGLLRTSLANAENYRRKLARGESDPEKIPDRDLRWEALILVLRGEIPLRIHAHRADDIMTALRIGDEFGLQIVLEHATEAHRVTEELISRGVPAVCGPILAAPTKVETRERNLEGVVALVRSGAKVALTTDHPITHIRYLQSSAVHLLRAGLDADEVLKTITINPAEINRIDDRVGQLRAGLDADVVVWTGDPLDALSQPEMVLIEGRKVLDRWS